MSFDSCFPAFLSALHREINRPAHDHIVIPLLAFLYHRGRVSYQRAYSLHFTVSHLVRLSRNQAAQDTCSTISKTSRKRKKNVIENSTGRILGLGIVGA